MLELDLDIRFKHKYRVTAKPVSSLGVGSFLGVESIYHKEFYDILLQKPAGFRVVSVHVFLTFAVTHES